jgi:taurine dioxygenase
MPAVLDVRETDESRRTGMGAVVEGLDLRADLDAETVAAIRQAALAHPVLVIPGQDLTPEQLAKFARTFGDIQLHTAVRYRHPDFPELSYVSNILPDGTVDTFGHNKRATGWHSDGSFLKPSYSFTTLYAVEAPKVGGPTLFCNTELAYERLPEDLKRRADAAIAVHALGSGPDGKSAPSYQARQDRPDLYPEVEKPVVQVHNETGRRALFLNPTHTSHIVGEDRDDPNSLYAQLVAHCIKPDFVYEHRWAQGDLVIWDQRNTMHRAGGGLGTGERRIMLRAVIRGWEPELRMAS